MLEGQHNKQTYFFDPPLKEMEGKSSKLFNSKLLFDAFDDATGDVSTILFLFVCVGVLGVSPLIGDIPLIIFSCFPSRIVFIGDELEYCKLNRADFFVGAALCVSSFFVSVFSFFLFSSCLGEKYVLVAEVEMLSLSWR